MIREEKGITLVALIITIIILLILSAVSIMSVTGTGLFSKTSDAVDKYNNSTEKENQIFEDYIAAIEGHGKGGSKVYYFDYGGMEEHFRVTINSNKISIALEKYIVDGVDYTDSVEEKNILTGADLSTVTAKRNIKVEDLSEIGTEATYKTIEIDTSYKSFTVPEAADCCYINNSHLYIFIDDHGSGFYMDFQAK